MAEPFFQNWNEKKIKWKSFPSSQRVDNLFSKNHKPLKKTSDFFSICMNEKWNKGRFGERVNVRFVEFKWCEKF